MLGRLLGLLSKSPKSNALESRESVRVDEFANKTDDVFGISRELPLNYVSRKSVDERFIDNLTREKHIVIFGSSKQGKTSLRKKCLDDTDYITVHCSNKWGIADVHSNILKRAGFEVTQSTKKTAEGKQKIEAKFTASVFGVGVGAGGGKEQATGNEMVTTPLELEPEDVNDVIAALKSIGFAKYIVLEDFHHLPIETQKDFSVSLKAFHEASEFCFIIVGVWLEENRLTVYNGDLSGRITAINADLWNEDELSEVIRAGEALLNVVFDDETKRALVSECEGSVSILQEACHKICKDEAIHRTCSGEAKVVGVGVDVQELITGVVNNQRGRYNSFLTQFADGFQHTALQMYRWLLYPIICADQKSLERGLKLSDIRKSLVVKHPQKNDLNTGNITQALQAAAALQVKKDIKPLILDYDQTNLRLNVVDRGFIIWLGHQDKNEVLEELDLPKLEPAAA